jgi:hypothetical protein
MMLLITSDKVSVEIPDSLVMQSELLKNMHTDIGLPEQLDIDNVTSEVVDKIITWHNMKIQKQTPNLFFHALHFKTELLPIMVAADFLMIDELFQGAMKYVRDQIKMLTPQQLREYFNCDDSWSKEEQEQLDFMNDRVLVE